ncbi:MAG: TlyA family RNA methyltransferase [Spirochaetaceae bacterium]|nr:MAG: TlyA family RNA methyltransferase [Spirochaetaceae bacterium]
MSRRGKPLRELLRKKYPDYHSDRIFALINSGMVSVNGEVVRDGASLVPVDADIILASASNVPGRGYDKLEAAISEWKVPVKGKVWLDAGASTGGFTACLLAHGAAAVHAVDVGYNQLDYRLRIDDRVHVHERANIMQPREYLPAPDAFCMDLSFRSALNPVLIVLGICRLSWGIVLLKPQFEWVDPPDWFNGIVPDDCLDEVVQQSLEEWRNNGVAINGIMPSPVKGRQGNQEFLVLVGDYSPDL